MKNENLAVDVVTNELVDSNVSSLLSAEEEVTLAQKIAEGSDEQKGRGNEQHHINQELFLQTQPVHLRAPFHLL